MMTKELLQMLVTNNTLKVEDVTPLSPEKKKVLDHVVRNPPLRFTTN
jgi:hypothetical protein